MKITFLYSYLKLRHLEMNYKRHNLFILEVNAAVYIYIYSIYSVIYNLVNVDLFGLYAMTYFIEIEYHC